MLFFVWQNFLDQLAIQISSINSMTIKHSMITWFQFFFRPLLRVEKCWGTIYGFQTWSRLLTSIKFLPDRFGTMGSPASPKRRGSPLRKKKSELSFFRGRYETLSMICKLWICLGRFPESWWFSVFDLPVAQGDLPGILRFRSCQFFVFLQFSELEWILLTSRFDQGLIDIIKEMILNPWSWYCAVPTVLPLQNW